MRISLDTDFRIEYIGMEQVGDRIRPNVFIYLLWSSLSLSLDSRRTLSITHMDEGMRTSELHE